MALGSIFLNFLSVIIFPSTMYIGTLDTFPVVIILPKTIELDWSIWTGCVLGGWTCDTSPLICSGTSVFVGGFTLGCVCRNNASGREYKTHRKLRKQRIDEGIAEVSVQLIYAEIGADVWVLGKIIHNFQIGWVCEISYALGTNLAESAFLFGRHSCPVFVTRLWDGNFHNWILFVFGDMQSFSLYWWFS